MSGQLPAKYDEPTKKETLPETPFETMASGHLCVKGEGFKYKGTILIPKSAERPSTAGVIVDLADDCREQLGGLERGTRILYSQFAGYLFNFKGAAGMRVMGIQEVLGKLKPEVELDDE